MAPGCIFQIFLWVTVQNQIGIAQRVIVDEIIQFRPLCHSHIQCILDLGAVNGDFFLSRCSSCTYPVSILNKQALASYFILVSFPPYGTFTVGLSCFFMIRFRTFFDGSKPSFCFPKKTKNPNPSPIGKSSDFVVGAMEGLEPPAY